MSAAPSTDPYLAWLLAETPTQWWHDSADPVELEQALAHGASGVTTNPILSAQALRAAPDFWRERLTARGTPPANPNPTLPNGSAPLERGKPTPLPSQAEERAISLAQMVVVTAAARLEATHRASHGAQGYVCAQVNPNRAADRAAMAAQARRFHTWAPNIAVKLPVTAAGLDVLEDCIAAGITVTATVSFTVPQVLAVAERHRRGAQRAQQAGIAAGRCFAVIMIGRLDDYLREIAADRKAGLSEADIRCAGLAVTKRAYALYQERQYEAVLLVAALRGVYHAAELAGANLILSIHPKYQPPLLAADLPKQTRIDSPLDAQAIERLRALPDFPRAYEPDGMQPEEFSAFGLTQRTLAQFSEGGWAHLESFAEK